METKEAMNFLSGKGVRGGGFGGKPFAQKRGDRLRPVWVVIAAGEARLPCLRGRAGLGLEESGVEFIKARLAKFQFSGRINRGEFAGSVAG
jgi:hypothetical protein